VNPWEDIPFPLHYPKTQKRSKRGSSFCNLRFALRFIFDRLSKSKKWSNMTKCSSKLGQGSTGLQNSPVNHPKSLRSIQLYFKGFELGSNYFNLLLCHGLLFGELLDEWVIYWSFQALFYGDDNLFKFYPLAFKFGEELTCLLLHWLKSLRDFHHFTLDHVDLLLGGALLMKPLHLFDW
jgi:hypothetical protein